MLALETFAMHDGWSAFIVLLFRDPHGLEGRQRCQNRAADPYGIFTLGWCNNFDFDG